MKVWAVRRRNWFIGFTRQFCGFGFMIDPHQPTFTNSNKIIMITDSEIKALADIEQEFRELSVYLDDLSQQKNRDAGHLWIAFIDKFQAFQKRVLSGAKKEDIPSKESQKQALIDLMEADQRDGIYGVSDNATSEVPCDAPFNGNDSIEL